MGLGDMARSALGKGVEKGAEKASSNAAHKSLSGNSDSPSHGNVGEGASNGDSAADKSANDVSSHAGTEADAFDGGNEQGGDLSDKMRDKATQKGAKEAGKEASDKLGQGNGQGLGQGDNGLFSQSGASSANGGGANAGGASNVNAGTSAASNAMSGVANAAGASAAGAAGSAAAGAAGAAGGASLGSAIVSAASNLAHAAAGAVSGIVSSVTSTVAAGIGAVSSAIGVAASTVTTVAVGGAVAATVAVGATTAAIISTNPGAYDTLVSNEDCATNVQQAKAAAEEVDADAAMLENAQKLYSVFKTRGWSDAMIAGMLSNFQAEGSIDPTAIEGIYDEPYTMGTRKTAAVNDNFQSQCQRLFADYAGRVSINQDAYRADDGNYYPGLGLCQWTGPGAKRLLDYAKSVNTDWYDMGYQIAYIIANGSPCIGDSFEEKYKSECGSADAATCARFFALKFENGNMPEYMIETHVSSASGWAAKMSSWTVDSSFANSIITMASKMGASASTSTVASAQKKCQKASNVDNSSLASAAVSYAWEHAHPDAEGNNGTQLYQAVCDEVIGDNLYMSCDHGVCAAVRWSGTDVDYPSGNCSTQWSYVTASDKWERVGTLGVDLTYEDLQPGDVAICAMSDSYTGGSEHTWLYVGNDAVKAKYPDSTYTSVNASYGERSAGCADDSWAVDHESRGHYGIFRCVNPDNSDQYKDAGAGQSGTS